MGSAHTRSSSGRYRRVDDPGDRLDPGRRARRFLGVAHGVEISGDKLFRRLVHLHGGPAPVRRFLPHLIELILDRKINPGKVFDLTLPLSEVAQGYAAMDSRQAVKTLLEP